MIWLQKTFQKAKKIFLRLILVDFSLPRGHLPNHIHVVILKAKIRNLVKHLPGRIYLSVDKILRIVKKQKKEVILLLLIGALGLNVGLDLKRRLQQESKIKQNQEIRALESKIEETINLLRLNPLKAKSLIESIEKELSFLEQRGGNQEKILGLKTRFNEFREQNFRFLAKENFPVFYDFSFLKQDAIGPSLLQLGQSLVVVDKKSGSVWLLNSKTKKLETLEEDSSEIKELIDAASYGKRMFLLTTQGVYLLTEGEESLKRIIAGDPSWKGVAEIDTYQGNNLYLLDREAGVIWKYQEGVKGWGEKRSYLAKEELDLKSASSLAVDGSLWVSFEEGGIAKLFKGKREEFSVTGMDQVFGAGSVLYTLESLDNIYVLDRKNNRLAVLNKLGNFLNQYSSSVFSQTSSFVVSETEKKVYLLVEKKILTLEIK